MMADYTVHEIRDISLGAVQRRRIDILVPDGLADDEMARILEQAAGRIVAQSFRDKLTKGPVLIAFVFAWTDSQKFGTSMATARALYIRDNLPEKMIRPTLPSLGNSRTVKALEGAITMEL